MTNLPNETAILALQREEEIAIYQRFFDHSTSGWRYRCGGVFNPKNSTFRDFTALRQNNPGKVKAAVERVLQMQGQNVSMAQVQELYAVSPTDNFLCFLADLKRFLSVNSLIVARHFREVKPTKIMFNQYAPIYNLIAALDFHIDARRVLADELPYIIKAASEPGFKDDQYGNGAGTLRALADMLARTDDDVQQLDVLLLSQKLGANSGKAERIVKLMRNLGQSEKAQKMLQYALLRWPDARPLKLLASNQ